MKCPPDQRDWKSVVKNCARFELWLANSFHEITFQNTITGCWISYLDATLWKPTENWQGFRLRHSSEISNISKTALLYFLWTPMISRIRNNKNMLFGIDYYSTLSKSLTLAYFSVSFVSFYAFAAIFSFFIETLSTNWGAQILAFTLVDVWWIAKETKMISLPWPFLFSCNNTCKFRSEIRYFTIFTINIFVDVGIRW